MPGVFGVYSVSHWIIPTVKCKLCGKLTYENRDDAEYAATRMGRQSAFYECPYGNGWHLTTVRKRGRVGDAGSPENCRTDQVP